jgi:hypothetical protein
MKINVIMLIIALAIGALAGYGFFAANAADTYREVIALGAGLSLFVTLGGIIAVGAAAGRGGVGNIRALSAVFFVLFLVEQLIFSFVPFRLPPYIITTGILLLVYLLIGYAVGKALNG